MALTLRLNRESLANVSVTRFVVALTSGLFFLRIFVLFVEAYSAVSFERTSDDRLLELCTKGAAAESNKFRTLCLQAKADRAAPVFAKAILRAIRTTFLDFTESFSSPYKLVILILFCVSGLALPLVRTLSSLVQTYLGPDPLARVQGLHLKEDDDQESCSVVVLDSARAGWRERLRHVPTRLKRNRLTMQSMGEEEALEEWAPVRLDARI